MEAMEGLCITNTKSKTHNFLLKALVSILVLKGRGQDQEQLKIYSFFFFFSHRLAKYLFFPYWGQILLHVFGGLKIINNFCVEQK